jgi:putative transcriptional regulator
MYDETKGDEIDLAGSLLLAHPHLKDANFLRSVVLMTAHDEEGSLGVVINHDTGQTLGEVNAEFSQYGLEDVPLYAGGPVSRDQIILAGWRIDPEIGEFKLYFGLDPETAQEKRQFDPNIRLRAFQGYSGWGKGQLLGELADNAWVVAGMDGHAVVEMEGIALWRHIIMAINPELGLLSFEPDSPEEN